MKTKINAEEVLLLFEDIKALLESLGTGLRECVFLFTDYRDSIGRMVSERTSQIRPDTLYKGNTYLGFIQVSGQYSPPFLRKYNLTVAPFISVPIGKLRKDEYQWLHGGVSFRIYFR